MMDEQKELVKDLSRLLERLDRKTVVIMFDEDAIEKASMARKADINPEKLITILETMAKNLARQLNQA
jgi:hypothetical protein